MVAEIASGCIAIASGIAIGITAIATGLAQKEIGTAAVGATAENDKNFAKGLVYMVLPETIVLFGLVIAFMLIQKI